jgi:hypothetical protein
MVGLESAYAGEALARVRQAWWESMFAAFALFKPNVIESRTEPLNRRKVLARYCRLREISKRHHAEVLKFISKDAILHHARRLGLARGKTLILDDMDEMNYAFDLAIHTASVGRSRAIDRYAKSTQLVSGSDEMFVLDAMRAASFSVLCIERRHEIAGLIATDIFRRTEVWLVDIGLEGSVPDGSLIATRLYAPERFAMTAGVNVPFDLEIVDDLVAELPRHLREKPLAAILDDRRFAETIYRVALAHGIMERIKYQDPPDDIR